MANESEKEGVWGAAPGPSSAVGPSSGGFGAGQMRPATMPPGFLGGNLAQSEQKDQELLWTSQPDGSRTDELAASSFTDLAAALGSGLAESMDDATRGEHTKTVLTENFLFKDQEDISYARHNRHAASRLLGAGQTQDAFGSHKTPEAGSLFSAFDSGEGVGGRAPGPAPASAMFDYSKDHANGSGHGGTLSSAFTPGPSDGIRGFQPKSTFDASKLTIPKELGTTVVEPDSYGGRGNDGTYELQRDMQNLWSNRDSQHDSRKSPQGASQMVEQPKAYQQPAEDELRPFTWDVRHQDASRALAIMRAGSLSASDVRSICESYGMIESFRSDFVEKGVFFVSYYDMRSAQYAAPDLQMRLQSLGPSAERVLVQYCVPLSSSSQLDESLVVLVGVPADMNIEMLAAMLGSYGAVRSLRSMGGNYGGNSFVVEYHDVQDAKQAALELESTQQFGPSVTVEVGARNPADRQRGRELLALLGRWRHGGGGNAGGNRQPRQTPHAPEGPRYDMGAAPGRDHGAQLVLGPDGRYSYMVVNHVGYPPGGGMGGPYGDRVMHSAHGTTYVNHVSPANHHQYWQPQTHHFSSNGSVVSQSSYPDSHSGHYPSGTQSLPYYRGDGNSSVGSHSNRLSVPGPSSASSAGGGGGDTQHLILDLDAVENGRDTRTSLMVRNIPNKYTQQMLLSEFTENGHGPGVIDFFYLPIDFKNRCNRGYAFINFVDYRDILAFHRRYFGKHWRTFNSDKICDITYARIQGKSAMLKRFENSALMEKDDEYKPLVFASSGAEKGTRLPFPNPNK